MIPHRRTPPVRISAGPAGCLPPGCWRNALVLPGPRSGARAEPGSSLHSRQPSLSPSSSIDLFFLPLDDQPERDRFPRPSELLPLERRLAARPIHMPSRIQWRCRMILRREKIGPPCRLGSLSHCTHSVLRLHDRPRLARQRLICLHPSLKRLGGTVLSTNHGPTGTSPAVASIRPVI
jgi:hypothetical protein